MVQLFNIIFNHVNKNSSTININTKPDSEKKQCKTSDSSYIEKHKAKHKAKRKIKTKFIVGGKYFLRFKPKDCSAGLLFEYVCKKYIYSMNDNIVNIVIMKQVSGPQGKKFTLTKKEAKQLHIKWEPGLEVLSMDMNWIPEKKSQNL